MKKLIILVILFTPFVSLAHVKWFAQENQYIRPYSLTDVPVLIWILVTIFLVSIGFYLESNIKIPSRFRAILDKIGPMAESLASIGFGAALIIFSLSGFVFAPNLHAEGSFILFLQGIAGVMIMLGIFERIGALLLLLTFVLGIARYGGIEMMDTFEMVGFALYALLVGRPKWKLISTSYGLKFLNNFESYAVPILRIATGINLIILALSEKIFASSLTYDFLSNYHWNFMQSFGMSNYWFAFSSGVVELLFGLFFVLGLITRTATIFLAFFLITTLILLGPLELIGHLPHFSIAIVLLVLGAGDKLKLHTK
ncbi:MAG: DoxX family membrane protein [Patescibacteria group bacterium]